MPYIIERRNAEVGTKINHWTIVELPPRSKAKVRCLCDCGEIKEVDFTNLLSGLSKRCRHCSTREFATRHGASDSGGKKTADRLYRIWKAMKWRCNPRNEHDKIWYVDRRIKVCDGWAGSYEAFRDWSLENGYRDYLTIDRINEYGPYTPANCTWSTPKMQARHTGRNRLLTAFGETKPVAEWAEDYRCQVREGAVRRRLQLGWSAHEAITTPRK